MTRPAGDGGNWRDTVSKQTKAAAQGTEDAQTWLTESTREEQLQSLQPGQEGADEALINALGTEKTAALFGVAHGSAAWATACDEYNAAFRATVAKAVAQ